MSNLHTPPIYHKNDLDFIHSEISKIRYDVRYRVARLYACIILQHLHSHEPDAIRTPNAARKAANTWLRTMADKYPKRARGTE